MSSSDLLAMIADDIRSKEIRRAAKRYLAGRLRRGLVTSRTRIIERMRARFPEADPLIGRVVDDLCEEARLRQFRRHSGR